MRRYFVAGALILVTGLGTYFAIGGGPGTGPTTGRIQRPPRYGGRAWPVPGVAASSGSCTTLAACTSGVTNRLVRSQEFASVSWTKSQTGGGAGAITVTDNYALAPDGTTTAARLEIPAKTSAQYALLGQSIAAGLTSSSIYCKGNGADGVLHLWQTSTGLNACVTCNCVGEAPLTCGNWTRCLDQNETVFGGASYYIGLDPADCGGGDRAAQDLVVWGAQNEANATVSGYVPTTSAAATCP